MATTEGKVDKADLQKFLDNEVARLEWGQEEIFARATKQFAEAEKFFNLERCTDEAAVVVDLGNCRALRRSSSG